MSHIYCTTQWQGGDEKWYVNDVKELATVASKWYTPARMLNIALTDYILLLRDRFNAQNIKYDSISDVLTFAFDTQKEATTYKNWINKEARNKNYIVGK